MSRLLHVAQDLLAGLDAGARGHVAPGDRAAAVDPGHGATVERWGLHRLRYLCQHGRARVGPDTPVPLFFSSEVPKAALTRILAYSYFTRASTSRLRTNPSKRPERDTGYWRTYLPKIGLPVPGTLADVWPGDPRNLPGWGFDPEADEDDPRNMLA